jgi:hypothetical protein
MIFFLIFNLFLIASNLDTELEKARKLYYKATEKEEFLEPAIREFEQIAKKHPAQKNLTMIYIGSLEMVKAKYAFLPTTKLNYANAGMEILDKWINHNQNNIESLFIYGMTYYHLPFFFNKSDEAEVAFKKIVSIATPSYENKELLKNALTFIDKKIKLDKEEKKKLNDVLTNL